MDKKVQNLSLSVKSLEAGKTDICKILELFNIVRNTSHSYLFVLYFFLLLLLFLNLQIEK